jgi:hypothetical protein
VTKLVGNAPQVNVQTNVGVKVNGGETSFAERVVKMADEVLYSRRLPAAAAEHIMEAEIVSSEDSRPE